MTLWTTSVAGVDRTFLGRSRAGTMMGPNEGIYEDVQTGKKVQRFARVRRLKI